MTFESLVLNLKDASQFTGDFDYPTQEGNPGKIVPYTPGTYTSYTFEEEDDE